MTKQMLVAVIFWIGAITTAVAEESPGKQASLPVTPQPQQEQPFDYKNPNEWIKLGENAGLAIAKVGEQLGVAGDKVLDSTSGKIAVGLIGAKVLGVTASDVAEIPYRIASFFLGIILFPFFLWAWAKYFRILCLEAPGKEETRSNQRVVHKGVMLAILGSGISFLLGLIFYEPGFMMIAIGIPIAIGVIGFLT